MVNSGLKELIEMRFQILKAEGRINALKRIVFKLQMHISRIYYHEYLFLFVCLHAKEYSYNMYNKIHI